jgi:hypothetical protein
MQRAEARARDALALRLRGHTYADIGDQLGVTLEGARQAVQRGMAEIRTQTAETAVEVREQEAARLDRMLVRLERMADQADDATTALAIQDRLLKIQDRRARLLGLDLQRLELTGANGGPIQIAAIQRVIVDPRDAPVTIDAEIQAPASLAAPTTAHALPGTSPENASNITDLAFSATE